MARITGLLCMIITGDIANAGTDGVVFLGIGGREFRIDSNADDNERGDWREYVMGRGPVEPLPPTQVRVRNGEYNDPRVGFPLDTGRLGRSPVYLRFEPEGPSPNWNLRYAAALVYVSESQFELAYTVPDEFDNLWLGKDMGKILYLTNEFRDRPQAIFERAKVLSRSLKR
jgi:hypothetical protein